MDLKQPGADTGEDQKNRKTTGERTSNEADTSNLETPDEETQKTTPHMNEGSKSIETDDELEEGELKDDDDDDDDDEIVESAKIIEKKASSKDTSDDSDLNTRKRSNSQSSVASDNSNNSNKPSFGLGEAINREARRQRPKTSSTISSSPSIERIQRPLSFRSRHESDSRHSSRSQSRSKRGRSPSNANQQARLITMRAKLLEAKAREIEMKFQKNKTRLTSASPISSTISLTPARNLKTTVAKPPITYAENPNPIDLTPPRSKSRSSKASKSDSREKSKKSSSKKKRKKKSSSSSSSKRKKRKTSESPKRSEIVDQKAEPPPNDEIGLDTVDHQGPKTPPDNQITTVDDEQVEWPSYLIKMTIAQPSISYSVNPDSVAGNNPAEQLDIADLNDDFNWYVDYFMRSYGMEKAQAQHQANTILVSSSYSERAIETWLEQQGLFKQSDNRKDVMQQDSVEDSANLPFRNNKPVFTTLKAVKDITLPNGKVLPRGTIQNIVHPYPRQERIIPDVTHSFSDLH